MRIPILSTALILVGSAAHAAPDDAIEWSAPAACPDRAAVVQQIENQLGTRLDRLRAELAAARDPGGRWRLRLAMRTPGGVDGKREIEGSTCDEVVTAAALIIALAIRAEAEPTDPPPASEPPAPPPPAPEAPPPVVAASGPAVQWLTRAGVGGEAGVLPGVGPGVGVAIGMLRARLRVEVLGAYWPHRRASVDVEPTKGGDLGLLAGSLRGCVVIAHDIAPCVGVEVGSLDAAGVGIADAMQHRTTWVAPSVGVLAPWRLSSSLFAVAQVDAVLPMIRPHFAIDGVAGDLYQPAAIAARVWVAIEARFP